MISVALIGCGVVGKEFLEMIQKSFNIVAVCNSTRMLLRRNQSDLIPSNWAENTHELDFEVLLNHISLFQNAVIVDSTSSDFIASSYPKFIAKGFHIVTPNKKPFSNSIDLFKVYSCNYRLFTTKKILLFIMNPRWGSFFNPSAGLPIISTLKDLVATNDHIISIEGIFSGTLSYIFNNFSVKNGPSFSSVVLKAKDLGYTEPDPRDDLNGLDVARKVVILARCLGRDLSLEDLDIQNIVPAELRLASRDDFLNKLVDYDAYFNDLNEKALKNGNVLRCVGMVDPVGKCGVKIVEYPFDHAFANLKGSDNVVKFTTQRFPNSIIIQGAGAGAAVTAFGMYSDLLKIQGRLTRIE